MVTQTKIGNTLVNECDLSSAWVMVHDSKKVISCTDTSGKLATSRLRTINAVFEADSREACAAEAARLKLTGFEDVGAPSAKPIAPPEVPLWALRSVLQTRGLLSKVDSLIASLPEPQKTVAYNQWQYGNVVERNHPLIASLGAGLSMSKNDIDSAFAAAAALK